MAVLMEIEFPGVTAAQYDSVDKAAGTRAAQPPAGLLFHTAIISGAGLRVVDLWESSGAFEAFLERLVPVIREAGLPDPPPPKLTEVHYHYEA